MSSLISEQQRRTAKHLSAALAWIWWGFYAKTGRRRFVAEEREGGLETSHFSAP